VQDVNDPLSLVKQRESTQAVAIGGGRQIVTLTRGAARFFHSCWPRRSETCRGQRVGRWACRRAAEDHQLARGPRSASLVIEASEAEVPYVAHNPMP